MDDSFEFIECEKCKAKPGMPILCKSCLHNRHAIYELKRIHGVVYVQLQLEIQRFKQNQIWWFISASIGALIMFITGRYIR